VADRRPLTPRAAAATAAAPGIDSETRAQAGDHMALRLWLRLLACTNLIEAPLRTRLREQFDGSLPRFDLMAQLDREPAGMKMRELSRRLMVTGGNVTGLTDRLVAEGLVRRREDPADRRATSVALTAEGRRQFRAMAKAHETWVVEIFSGLSTTQQAQLFELLGALKLTLPPADPAR
jgi:DNA-binding MarR family transcriptional regulator